MILSKEYIEFVERVEEAHHAVTISDQIIKLMEEVGELAAAWTGVQGTNPRKGFAHTRDDVSMETADVVLTALVLATKLNSDLDNLLAAQQKKVEGYLDALA